MINKLKEENKMLKAQIDCLQAEAKLMSDKNETFRS